MSVANQIEAADGIRSMNWMFDARLKIAAPQVAADVPVRMPENYFEDVLAICFPYQFSVLKRLEVLSFSCYPDWSRMLPGDPLQVTGLVVNKCQIQISTVADWLIHEDLEIKWSPITGRRHKDERVVAFLKASALREDLLVARAADDTTVHTSMAKLRVDKIGPSAPNRNQGRPAKSRKLHPDNSLGACADAAASAAGGFMLTAAAAPPPSLSDSDHAFAFTAPSTPSSVGRSVPGSVTGASTPSSTGQFSPGWASTGSTGASTPTSKRRHRVWRPPSDSGFPDSAQDILEMKLQLAAAHKENAGLKRKLEKKDVTIHALRDEKRKAGDMHRKRQSREEQREPYFEMGDGTRAPLIELNLNQLPTRNLSRRTDTEPSDSCKKGSRDYFPIVDNIVESTHGQTEARPAGGWGFRFIDKLRHYDLMRTLAQTAQGGIGRALERDYINRSHTGTVRVLPRPLSGTKYRRQLDPDREGKTRVYFRPSPQTMSNRVIPAMVMAFLKVLWLRIEQADRISIHFDGTDFGKFHVNGTLLVLVFLECADTDPFGNQSHTLRTERWPLLLQQVVNKIGKRIRKGGHGEFYSAETPRALCDAVGYSGILHLLSDNNLVGKSSLCSDGARDNTGCSPDDHPDTDAMCGQNSPVHSVYLTGEAPAETYKKLQETGLGEDVSQFVAGADLEDFTSRLKKDRLAGRRVRDEMLHHEKEAKIAATRTTTLPPCAEATQAHQLSPHPPCVSPSDSADKPNEDPLHQPGCIQPGGDSAAGSESTPMPDSNVAPTPSAATGKRVGAPSPMDAAGAGAKPTLRATYQKNPPEPRQSPPAIDRSGAVMRCQKRASWLRGYAEGKLRSWWPTVLAMRWAWGWWRVLSARRSLENTELQRIPSLAKPARPAARQAKFIAKMQEWMAKRHKLWMVNTLGGMLGEVKWEHVDETGAVDDAGTYIVPIRTIQTLPSGQWSVSPLSVFCRPVREDEAAEREKVEIVRHNASDLKLPKFFLFLRKLSKGLLVSMKTNPLRYYPGRDQRVNSANGPIARFRRIANAYACLFHNIHNASKRQFLLLNVGFASQIISAANVISSQYVRPGIEDAVKHLFDTRPDGINRATTFWERLREAIGQQHLRREGVSLEQAVTESGYDWTKGLPECLTARELRWGTVHKAARFLLMGRRFLSLGIGKRCGHAFREKDELDALLSCFSHRGFDSASHSRFRIEDQVKNVWALLAVASNQAQLAMVACLDSLFLGPLFAASSANKGCATSTMMGLNSVPRNLLLIYSRVIFVDTAQNGKGWDKWIALGHRTDGSEFGTAHKSIRVLNPNCGCEVNQLLGVFGNEHTKNAIGNLLSQFKRIAMLGGDMLSADLRTAYDAAHQSKNPKLYEEDEETRNVNSFAVNMGRLQWWFRLIANDVVCTLRSYFKRQLYGLEGFVAGIGKQLSTKPVPCLNGVDSTLAWDQTFTYADPWAQANAVILLVMGDELQETLEPQLKEPGHMKRRDIEDFFPPFVDVIGEGGRQELLDFLGLKREGFGDRFDRLEDLSLVAFDPETAERVYAVHGRSLFPRTVSRSDGRFSVLNKCYVLAVTTVTDSKSIEQWFSPMAASMKARGMAKMSTINGYYFRNGWDAANEDPMTVEESVYFAAEELAQKEGWCRVFGVDSAKRELMRKDQQRIAMPAAIKNGGNWAETNTQGDGRTDKYLNPKGKSDVARARQNLVNTVCDQKGQPRQRVNVPLKSKQNKPSSAKVDAAAADLCSKNSRKRKSDTSGGGGEVSSTDVSRNKSSGALQAGDGIDPGAGDEHGGGMELQDPSLSSEGLQEEGVHIESEEFSVLRSDGQGASDGGEDLEQIAGSNGLDLPDQAQKDRSQTCDSLGKDGPEKDGDYEESDIDIPIARRNRSAARRCPANSNILEQMSDHAAPEDGPKSIESSEPSVPAVIEPIKEGARLDAGVMAQGRTGQWDHAVDGNIWSYQFVLDVASQLGCNQRGYRSDVWQKSDVVYSKEPCCNSVMHCATVTRKFKKMKFLLIDPISFKVETIRGEANAKYFYIAFDEYASRFIVDIFEISEPYQCKGKSKHDKTMRFRRVWTALEGSTRTDREEDSQNGHLGSKSLRRIAEENEKSGKETFHVGDVEYEGDLRILIGVIKWFPQSYQNAQQLPSAYFQLYPKADSIRVGSHFSQKPSC